MVQEKNVNQTNHVLGLLLQSVFHINSFQTHLKPVVLQKCLRDNSFNKGDSIFICLDKEEDGGKGVERWKKYVFFVKFC